MAVATLLSAGQCMDAPAAENLNLSLSDAIAVSALPAAINMPWNALPLCPLSWQIPITATVFLPLTKTYESFSLMTEHCLTVSFMPWTVLFPKCFAHLYENIPNGQVMELLDYVGLYIWLLEKTKKTKIFVTNRT